MEKYTDEIIEKLKDPRIVKKLVKQKSFKETIEKYGMTEEQVKNFINNDTNKLKKILRNPEIQKSIRKSIIQINKNTESLESLILFAVFVFVLYGLVHVNDGKDVAGGKNEK